MGVRGLAKRIERSVMDTVAARLQSDVAEPLGQTAVEKLKEWTQHWRNQPTFAHAVSVTYESGLDVCVTFTIGGTERAKDIFNFVDGGVRVHDIRPKTKPVLIFRAGYRRAITGTKPNYQSVGPASRFGARCVARAVLHPGISCRDLTGSAVTLAENAVRKRLVAAVQKAVLKPGITVEVVRGGKV